MTANPHPASWRSTQIAPFLYPLLPASVGTLRFVINLRQFFQYDHARDFDGALTLTAVQWSRAAEVRRETIAVPVRRGKPDLADIEMRWQSPDETAGYVDVEVAADRPIFHRPLYEIGYGVVERVGYGALTVIESPKFADPRVIEQVRELGRYSVAHTMVRGSDITRGSSKFLLVNPYEKALGLDLRCPESGTYRRVHVPARTTLTEPLGALVGDREWGTVILSARQRVIVYCMSAPASTPDHPNSIDHLDPFRGERTFANLDLRGALRHTLRRIAKAARLTSG
jgi:hypothetical protein